MLFADAVLTGRTALADGAAEGAGADEDAPLPVQAARLSAKVRDSTIASIFFMLISFLSSVLHRRWSPPPRLSMCTVHQNDTLCSKPVRYFLNRGTACAVCFAPDTYAHMGSVRPKL